MGKRHGHDDFARSAGSSEPTGLGGRIYRKQHTHTLSEATHSDQRRHILINVSPLIESATLSFLEMCRV
jgi:hypothetical protein